MALSDRPILVPGGAGLKGRALVRTFNKRGRTDILIADILGSDVKWQNLLPLRFVDYMEAETLLNELPGGD